MKPPFIEMKTFRSDQSLVTIPCTQFSDNHYFVIVESHLEDDYLSSIFDDELFENEEYYNFVISQTEDELIISNNDGIIKKPDKLTKTHELGYYELIGIYKGINMKQFYQIVKKGDKPLYYYGEIDPPSRFQRKRKIIPPIKLNSGLYYFDNDDKNIPIHINISDGAELKIFHKISTALDVEVKGHVEVDGNKLKEGMRRLKFKEFEKNGKEEEVAMTKSILKCYNESISATEELISEFDNIVK